MAVARVTEIIASSKKSFADAVEAGIARALVAATEQFKRLRRFE
mgnify:CR=1 FL=1